MRLLITVVLFLTCLLVIDAQRCVPLGARCKASDPLNPVPNTAVCCGQPANICWRNKQGVHLCRFNPFRPGLSTRKGRRRPVCVPKYKHCKGPKNTYGTSRCCNGFKCIWVRGYGSRCYLPPYLPKPKPAKCVPKYRHCRGPKNTYGTSRCCNGFKCIWVRGYGSRCYVPPYLPKPKPKPVKCVPKYKHCKGPKNTYGTSRCCSGFKCIFVLGYGHRCYFPPFVPKPRCTPRYKPCLGKAPCCDGFKCLHVHGYGYRCWLPPWLPKPKPTRNNCVPRYKYCKGRRCCGAFKCIYRYGYGHRCWLPPWVPKAKPRCVPWNKHCRGKLNVWGTSKCCNGHVCAYRGGNIFKCTQRKNLKRVAQAAENAKKRF